jgi:two-component system phosphate regulon sensor histidine kinase PhoR
MKPSLFGKTLALIVVSLSIATTLFVLIAVILTDRLLIDSNSNELLKTTYLAAIILEESGTLSQSPTESRDISSLTETEFDRITNSTGYRITLVDKNGVVIADSAATPSTMENHGEREEIRGALQGKAAKSVRTSATTGIRTLYTAVPIYGRADIYALRLAMPLPPSIGRVADTVWFFALFLVVILAVSLIASYIINRQITLPVRHIVEKAKALAKGSSISRKPSLFLPLELKIIDESLDMLVATIRERTDDSERMSMRLSSILKAAGEGIVATDSNLKIIEANSAAEKLFSIPSEKMIGKTILEALGNKEIDVLFKDCLEKKEELFKSTRILSESLRHVKIHASPLEKDSGAGVVAVFGDVTDRERLEKVRKDFVANVSHELRTPIQIIKGYAEILVDTRSDQDTVSRYLELIRHNTMRMERIINDLLMIARLEGDKESWIKLEYCDLVHTVESSILTVQALAEKKNIDIEFDHPPTMYCMANGGLIEQAIFNLLDNAVTYSPPTSHIKVLIREAAGPSVEISVSDEGIGIPAKDIDRIFERFYRVDKSRSKKTGGTGLGLSIVKHIASIHGGEVSATSYLNEGSTFTLRIPSGLSL